MLCSSGSGRPWPLKIMTRLHPVELGLSPFPSAVFRAPGLVGRFFAGLLKTKRPYRTHPLIPGSQRSLLTFWHMPFASCGQPQLLIFTPQSMLGLMNIAWM